MQHFAPALVVVAVVMSALGQLTAGERRWTEPAFTPEESRAPASQSGTGQVITHAELYKLMMASNSELLAADEYAALEYHLLTKVPLTVDGTISPPCLTLIGQMRNEVIADRLKTQMLAEFQQALSQLAGTPRTRAFTFQSWVSLGPYDSGRRTFPIDRASSGMLWGGRVRVPRDAAGLRTPEEIQRRPASAFGSFCVADPIRPWKVATIGRQPSFEFALQDSEWIQEFPMDPGVAEALLSSDPDRRVTLELQLELGPVDIPGRPTPARVTAARVMNRADGRVLHVFRRPNTSQTPIPAESPVAPRTAAGAVAYTETAGLLLTVRDQPQLVTSERLASAIGNQVGAEQTAWRAIDAAKQSGAYRWNPRKRDFTYEWQSLIETDARLAEGPVLDAFLRAEPDWQFVTRDPSWDARFQAVVEVFMFSRARIEGREPSFAAQELAPVFKRHLDLAVARVPAMFWLDLPIQDLSYDFASRSLQLLSGTPRRQFGFEAGPDLLPRISDEARVTFPASVGGRVVYGLAGAAPQQTGRETRPGVPLGASPITVWRQGWLRIPTPNLIALDRRLELRPVPMEPARAEPLVKARNASGRSPLTARVYITSQRVDLGSATVDRVAEPRAVLLATVQKVDVIGPDGQVVATVDAGSLPAAVESASRPGEAVTTAPASQGPTRAEREAERRRQLDAQEAEQSQRISEELRKGVDACYAAAAKAGPLASKPYVDVLSACLSKKK